MRLRFVFLCLIFSLASAFGTMAATAGDVIDLRAAALFSSDCTDTGGKIVKTPTQGVLICRQSDGFDQTCDFRNALGGPCGGNPATKTYDHSADIGMQATKCLAEGGTLTSGNNDSMTCKLPDGSGEICWYGPLSQYVDCSGFDGTVPNKASVVSARDTANH